MSEEPLLRETSEGVLTLTLNRPDKLNAFTPDMHRALHVALGDAAEDAAIRAVLLTGAGRGFCAGQDLGDRNPDAADGPPDLGETIETFYNPLIRAIRSLAKPVVCAVNGVAAGAGANIALACDIVLAAEGAKFVQSFSKLGLVPDSGGTWMLARLIGEARAKALFLTAEPITASQAAEWGLIWRAVPDAELMVEARQLAEKLAAGPTFGLGLIKQAVHASADQSLDASLDLERDLQRRAGRSADYAEGVRAFLQRRKPTYSGVE
ncbi:2-(1,2-epoxy-1,2-dihydrophenyl)acetyl-CoA isomerase PaaG [Aurantimonas sp. VKM B-3413]|uniref:2-(1,2-epoxy-1,2-dihydrophenyl)acetyl-CoA isomerase PaaG n=1 Tax=Aurantimonas sp. VKM B-3413 TaxID=2779401 RepID=UPI001E3A1096|nr:2-(1,2-epoxy-1,2-dihydrophenyl)acetyl-CoA isomerase PaaG [Aurantimonas sp. VKM B-3413]MCB8836375.1 2-(1,2-epoxy-1,2-dihydrophenyl)acetyl-CoA isomerase PaaG [Aurantimonas sp. VKM B-3413]